MSGLNGRRLLGFGLAVGAGVGAAVATGVLVRSPSGTVVAERSVAGSPLQAAPQVDAGPVAAMQMVDRLQLFQTGNAGTRIALDAADLTALLRHAIPGMLPEGVSDPIVRIVGSEVWVRARVSPSALPGGARLGGVLAVVPDAVDVELRGSLSRPTSRIVAYRIERAEVEGVALPPSMMAALVRGWPGGIDSDQSGESGPAIRMRWPIEGGRFRIADGVLIIDRPEPLLLQSVDGSGGG